MKITPNNNLTNFLIIFLIVRKIICASFLAGIIIDIDIDTQSLKSYYFANKLLFFFKYITLIINWTKKVKNIAISYSWS